MATYSNENAEDFGDADAAVTVSQYRLTHDPGGTNELSTGWIDLDNSRSFVAGDPIEIPAGDLSIEIPAGDFGAAYAKGIVDSLLSHRGANARAELGHNDSELTDSGYAEQTVELVSAE